MTAHWDREKLYRVGIAVGLSAILPQRGPDAGSSWFAMVQRSHTGALAYREMIAGDSDLNVRLPYFP